MGLRDMAAAAAEPGDTEGPWAGAEDRPTPTPAEPLPDIEYTGPIADVDQVPVHVAWARVMADVQSVSKGDRRDDVGGRYNFRGVDRVVNAVGPALRRHGVLVLPTRILSVDYREARTAKGSVMQDCTVRVQWTVRGPAGDDLPAMESAGQATDTQDKSTAKAISVAQRVLFLSALHIPTQDPDVDRGHERGEAPTAKPGAYRDEITDPRTSLGRLRQIYGELTQHRLGGAIVVNEVGDDEPLGQLYQRIVAERRAAAGGDPA
jgi:hypothetical protein